MEVVVGGLSGIVQRGGGCAEHIFCAYLARNSFLTKKRVFRIFCAFLAHIPRVFRIFPLHILTVPAYFRIFSAYSSYLIGIIAWPF